ncbi:MAG: D-alanyl-D-alanine carboxypeptidase [Thiotrichaceae bacterium]|nr:D-alanyl-D-alanine carboxypeptidase [Thiotrichaceae bacterium]
MKMLFRFCCFLLVLPVFATAAEVSLTPTVPPIAARAYILQDFHSKRILMEKNSELRIEPASLTKLMTAYLTFEALQSGKLKLTDTIKISENAHKMSGSRMYLEKNTDVPVELLVKGMIIQSGNDASVALAEFLGGGKEEVFVAAMNEKAKTLGLSNTHYVNSTGLPDAQHYSTTQDLARLAQSLIERFPEYYHWYSEKTFSYHNITQTNRNLLLWRDPTVDGMKTGYTESAGYCLVSSAKRDNMRLVSVVVGTENPKARAAESQKMLDYGFRFFETLPLYKAQEALKQEKVWQGTEGANVALGLAQPLFITIPRGQYSQLNINLFANKRITAPVKVGDPQGNLKITLGNQLIVERPVIALSSVEAGNLWRWFVDYFLLKFE